jgi:hypothetical protein
MDQARAWKHGLLGRDAVLTIIGLRNAGKLPDCGTPAREQVIDLAGAGDARIGTVILIRDHEYVCEDRGARADAIETAGAASQIPADCHPEVYDEGFWSRVDAWAGQFGLTKPRRHCAGIRGARGRVMAWLAAGYGVVAAGGLRGEEDEQA